MEDVNKLRMLWMESAERRLHDWREFRLSIADAELSKICHDVHQLWAFAPQSNITIDPYDTNTWVDAWSMVSQGEVCKFSSAIGMAFTIFYINEGVKNDIMRVNDTVNNDIYMICLIDNEWVLNYDACTIAHWSEVQDSLEIQARWTCQEVVDETHR